MIRTIALAAFAFVLATSTAAGAQQASNDPIRDALIPPDVVMSHQQQLGLTDAQRVAIQSAVLIAQGHFMRWQSQLQAATGKLVDILRRPHVDQTQALAQMDVVLGLEREVKHAQLTLMVQIKNELTPQQQATAHALESGASP